MTIKVNYTKEKGLVQELDATGEGGFLVQGTEIGKKKVELIEANITLTANDTNKIFRVRNNNKTILLPEPSADLEGVIYKFVADADMTNTTTIKSVDNTAGIFVGSIIAIDDNTTNATAADQNSSIVFNKNNPAVAGESNSKRGDFVEITCLNTSGVGGTKWTLFGVCFGTKSIYFS